MTTEHDDAIAEFVTSFTKPVTAWRLGGDCESGTRRSGAIGRAQFQRITKGVAQQKVSLDRFRQIVIALPGSEEQRELAERLDVELERLRSIGFVDRCGVETNGSRSAEHPQNGI